MCCPFGHNKQEDKGPNSGREHKPDRQRVASALIFIDRYPSMNGDCCGEERSRSGTNNCERPLSTTDTAAVATLFDYPFDINKPRDRKNYVGEK
jgi:hypothetical protein